MDRRLLELNLKTSLSTIADLALPRHCLVCGRKLIPEESHLCLGCLADLPETHFSTLRINPMADSLNARIEDGGHAQGERYLYATALFYYQGGYKKLTPELKYRRNFAAGKHLARLLGERIASSPLYADVDAVVPVPLHWTRRFKRGYNQAEIIAEEVARALGAECRAGLLARTRRTRTQTVLGKSGKAANVKGAFRATRRGPVPGHILLIDDVCTTGSTLYECYTALRRVYGPDTRISAATLAFVP